MSMDAQCSAKRPKINAVKGERCSAQCSKGVKATRSIILKVRKAAYHRCLKLSIIPSRSKFSQSIRLGRFSLSDIQPWGY